MKLLNIVALIKTIPVFFSYLSMKRKIILLFIAFIEVKLFNNLDENFLTIIVYGPLFLIGLILLFVLTSTARWKYKQYLHKYW